MVHTLARPVLSVLLVVTAVSALAGRVVAQPSVPASFPTTISAAQLDTLLGDRDDQDRITIPEIGKVPATTALDADFEPLPPGVTYGGDTKVPAGTRIGELNTTDLAAIYNAEPDTHQTFINLIMAFDPGPPDEVPPDPTYNIIVEEVDSSRFPRMRVTFRVFPKDVTTPPFDVNNAFMQRQVMETVLGDQRAATDPVFSQCGQDPVAMAIAIDSSCSVTKYLGGTCGAAVGGNTGGMLDCAAQFMEQLRTRPGGAETLVSVFAFDGKGLSRAPDFAESPLFAKLGADSTYPDRARAIDIGPPCSGSPIYHNMRLELLRLAGFDTSNTLLKRSLVTIADFRDTQGAPQKRAVIEAAQQNDVTVVNLGFGRVNLAGISEVSDKSGGTFIQGASSAIIQALNMTYDGLANRYCVDYTSPHPDSVNETGDVSVVIGTSMGSAKFPLPFVIPEDTPGPRLFFPLTKLQYEKLTSDGSPPPTSVKVRYFDRTLDADGDPVPLTDPPGPDRATEFDATVDPASWAEHPGDGFGFFVDGATGQDAWNALFRIPTDFVDPTPPAGGPPQPIIRDARHYQLEVRYQGSGGGLGKPYPSRPRLSIQDRTPPHVMVRIAPQDGAPPFEVRLFEDGPDLDPALVTDGRARSADAKEGGFGAKRGRIQYSWRTDGTAGIEGDEPEQLWHRPGTEGAEEFALVDPGQQIFVQGAEFATKARVEFTVLARDNFGLLEDSTSPLDAASFSSPGSGDEGPVHSRFELRPEATKGSETAPFLPRVPRAELEADPAKPGLSWWIESKDPQDRFGNLEFLEEATYQAPDEVVFDALVASGHPDPDVPLRRLRIRAQDGHGNVSLVEIPLFVKGTTFEAKTMSLETRRQGLD